MFGPSQRCKPKLAYEKHRPHGYDVPTGEVWQQKLDEWLGIPKRPASPPETDHEAAASQPSSQDERGVPPWLGRLQGGVTEDKGGEETSKAHDKGKRKKTRKEHNEEDYRGEDNW